LIDIRIDIGATGNPGEQPLGRITLGTLTLEEGGHWTLFPLGQVTANDLQGVLAILHLDHIAGGQHAAGDIAMAAIDSDMAVGHDLAGGGAAGSPTQTVDDIVEPSLHQRQELLAGVACGAGSVGELTGKLTVEETVKTLQLLLLTQPGSVFGRLGAAGGCP